MYTPLNNTCVAPLSKGCTCKGLDSIDKDTNSNCKNAQAAHALIQTQEPALCILEACTRCIHAAAATQRGTMGSLHTAGAAPSNQISTIRNLNYFYPSHQSLLWTTCHCWHSFIQHPHIPPQTDNPQPWMVTTIVARQRHVCRVVSFP